MWEEYTRCGCGRIGFHAFIFWGAGRLFTATIAARLKALLSGAFWVFAFGETGMTAH